MKGQFSHKNTWKLQRAKAHFSELIQKAINEGDQVIANRDEAAAVVISKARYDNFMTPDKSLIDFFYSAPYPEIDLDTKEIGR